MFWQSYKIQANLFVLSVAWEMGWGVWNFNRLRGTILKFVLLFTKF